MAESIFLGTGVDVDAAGGLTGDGTSGDPLAVEVDGTTIEINGSNQLAVTGALPSDSTITVNGIGTTSTDGLVIQNTTDAAAGAQQYSPRLRLRGEGWKTNATAASQTVDFKLEVQPVQGTSAPSGNLVIAASINGGAYSTVGTLSSSGEFTAPSSLTGLTAVINQSGVYAFGGLGGWRGGDIDGAVRLVNNSQSNTLDCAVENWGAKLSAESVTVADAGTLNLGAAPLGLLTITLGTDNYVGRFELRGSSNAVVADDGNNAVFTTTKDNASTVNVYFDTNAYFIQNNRGGSRALRVLLIGA